MANTSSAKKAIRVAEKNYVENQKKRDSVRKVTKAFTNAVEGNDKKKAEELLPKVYKQLDKAAKTRVITKNKAARQKAKYTRMLANTK